ncbi:hypothetical protein Zm00014a_012329 [Zea mays]|uniref:Uncharacterized protein n=1 Tax=Zea mays TaxID=4577 RepID=A0A3L6DP54_MAIZE|nr:hypothetical protein Zm00014a_012329 [Zea mays]
MFKIQNFIHKCFNVLSF